MIVLQSCVFFSRKTVFRENGGMQETSELQVEISLEGFKEIFIRQII